MMENEIFIKLESDKTKFTKKYNNVFNDKLYPNFIAKSLFKTFYVNEINYLNNLIKGICSKSDDKLIYLKSYDFRTNSFNCYKMYSKNLDKLNNDKLFEMILYSNDNGFVIFGDSSNWGIYVGEDLYYKGKRENFTEFLLIFVKEELVEYINFLYQSKFDLLYNREYELKENYFVDINDKQYIICLNFDSR